jgi:hypothetical protein
VCVQGRCGIRRKSGLQTMGEKESKTHNGSVDSSGVVGRRGRSGEVVVDRSEDVLKREKEREGVVHESSSEKDRVVSIDTLGRHPQGQDRKIRTLLPWLTGSWRESRERPIGYSLLG